MGGEKEGRKGGEDGKEGGQSKDGEREMVGGRTEEENEGRMEEG